MRFLPMPILRWLMPMVLLTGCVAFHLPVTSSLSKNDSAAMQLEPLIPGDWCRIQLIESRAGLTTTNVEHIGRVKTADEESIVIENVTTHRRVSNAMVRVPYLGRLFTNTGGIEDETTVNVPRTRIARLERVSAERAKELSQPLERICIGVDSTSDPNQPESLPVLKASYESLLSASSPSKKKPVGTGTESTAPVQTSGSNRKDESIPVESVTASTSSAASFQRSLLYFPLPSERLLARESGLSQAVIDVQVTTHDQLTLNGWLILVDRPQAENRQFDAANPAELLAAERPLVIVFPGNGGHRLMRQDLVNALSSIGVDVMLFDYRGYGDNPGAPAEVHLVQDARAIWNCTVRDFGVPARRIFIYGESLGGGVATRLASDLCAVGIQPGGLILQSTFNSVVAVGRYHFPVLPVSTLSVDRFESERHITKVTCPYLHLHGERDTVVPIKLGKKLYRAAPEASSAGIPKQFVSLPGTNHNDVYGSSGKLVLNVLRNFLQLR